MGQNLEKTERIRGIALGASLDCVQSSVTHFSTVMTSGGCK
jgi:hypothetical protein